MRSQLVKAQPREAGLRVSGGLLPSAAPRGSEGVHKIAHTLVSSHNISLFMVVALTVATLDENSPNI